MRTICVLLPDAHGPDVTTYLYDAPASQSRQSLATQWRRAEAVGLAIDQAFTEQEADVPTERRPVYDKLKAGDTLVVSGVGCLGESYAEITDAIRDLMRRRICVRSINDNLTFDGRVADAGKQASRDSLIAFAAAAAETQKTAKRAAQTRQALVEEVSAPEPVGKDRHGPVLQFGVVAAQLSALAVAAYLASFVSPKLSRHSPASPPAQMAALDRQRAEAPLPPPADFREIPREKPAIVASDSNNQEASGDARQSLGISPEREQEIFSTVGDWRSARVKDASFAIAAGAIVPRGVRLAIFPRRLVAREAVLRGYRFIVSGQRIGVVDPTSRQIVAILKKE
ncbi:DUF1236 domain-containing protein [Methylocystis sp. Sn-Cys]|uniref:DUF1236 domain-containing protein n=1 Tax=Methylocystis sp. Sn-Cys TaxID=1701263 RepID=UPI0019229390|nr:DUF1236 domain-containing protein [Methylocystis sp. Sn-Cys]MBL1255251.1 DUF1236 domain-containing protein [Methylocystis sp. Sn-Cys]